MKKHILSAVAILVIGLGISSCSDYLSVERFFKDRQSEEKIFKSKNFTEQWLAKCYNCLLETNLEITRIGYSTTNFADDMIFNESDGAVTYNAFKFGQYDNTWTNNSYIRCYEGIRQASILINNIDINEELSEVEIADYKAQARFLRSYFYWLLLRKYGPVPLIPEETISIDEDYMDMSYPRSSYDEVVNYISEEMALAARSLPEKRDRQNVNRSTAYPATVRPPYHSVYSNKDFPEGWADIDPFASYRSIFNGDLYATENPELIFTRGNNALNDQVRDLVLDHLPTNAGGRNRHGLTIKQCDAYDMADGSSFNLETFLDTCEVDKRFVSEDEYNRGLYPQIRPRVWKEYANREPRFYASVAFNGAFWALASAQDGDRRNQQVWYYRGSDNGRKNSSDYWIPTGIGVMKFVSPNDCNTNNGRIYDKVDIPLRYTDILLMYAEALNELTPSSSYEVTTWEGEPITVSRNTEEIRKAVLPVRMRAGVPDYNEETYNDQTLFRKKLIHERQVEFMGENQRYYDLRRWKLAPVEESEQIYGYNVLMTESKKERFYERIRVENLQANFSRKMYFWPMPQNELKRNRKMTQAPGWETFD